MYLQYIIYTNNVPEMDNAMIATIANDFTILSTDNFELRKEQIVKDMVN